MKPLAPNTLLQNRYLLVQLIGKGGMGEVYLAVDQRLGSAVALKRTYFTEDEMLGSAFEREARTLARLRHPVLPKVSDHFAEDENQYLVMEHISGDDLSKRLEVNKKPFPLNWVLFWADQLLDALHYLHSHNPPIIHRDIKPQNLKLTDENHIVLLDFGLAKNTVGQTRVTTSGSIVGFTPHYAPMEQIRGSGTSAKSDIYSLSATLYQLVTNTVPLDALSRADSMLSGLPDSIIPISELNPEVPKPISDIIIKGMALSQDQRHATAREMQKALRDAYARLQSAMSAQTLMFNTQDMQTDQLATMLNEPPPALPVSSAQTGAVNTNAAGSPPTGQMNFSGTQEEAPNFDQTLPYNSFPRESTQKQTDIKTEVILPSGSLNTDSQPNNYSSAETSDPTVAFNSQGGFDQTPSSNQSYSSYDSSSDGEESFITPVTAGSMPVGETFVPASGNQYQDNYYVENQYDNAEENYNVSDEEQAFVQNTPPPQQKSGSRTMLLIGGLAAFLVLLIGAAGAGWIVLSKMQAEPEVTENPLPTPQPSVTPEPTPAETPQIVTTADVVNTNSESNTSVNTNTSETNTATDETTTTATTDAPSRPTPPPTKATPRTTPQQVVKAQTPRATPPVKTETPKKDQGTKGRSTDILQ